MVPDRQMEVLALRTGAHLERFSMNFDDITAAVLRNEGITIVGLARRASIPYTRLYDALNGKGTRWLAAHERERLRAVLSQGLLLTEAK
jgi:predicted transcriptional regulator